MWIKEYNEQRASMGLSPLIPDMIDAVEQTETHCDSVEECRLLRDSD